MRAMMWFRSDLRVCDNTALHYAARSAEDGVIGLFVISPQEWLAHDYSPRRIDLMRRTLVTLSASLEKLNIPLRIVVAEAAADVPGLVLRAASEFGCGSVFMNKEYEVDERARDQRTARLLEKSGINMKSFTDQVLIEPGDIRTQEGTYYSTFTPFSRAVLKELHVRGVTVLPSPRVQRTTGVTLSPVPSAVPDYSAPASNWPAGEANASAVLERFVDQRISTYKSDRDIPGIEGTSRLSPYLAIGALSPRQCYAAANRAGANSGTASWVNELLWREFYVHICAGFPRVCMNRAFKPTTEAIRWSRNQAHLAAWQSARTGVPIVDAGMRELLSTGWMHNRVRMITAMYLSKNLFIDWREGERCFMRHLVDGFFASNNGGWQWCASTGTDAAPYFRVFNPVSQSRKFDPAGVYLRRWLPEIATLDDTMIHAPWELPSLARAAVDYPAPLIDLRASRADAIAAFAALQS